MRKKTARFLFAYADLARRTLADNDKAHADQVADLEAQLAAFQAQLADTEAAAALARDQEERAAGRAQSAEDQLAAHRHIARREAEAQAAAMATLKKSHAAELAALEDRFRETLQRLGIEAHAIGGN